MRFENTEAQQFVVLRRSASYLLTLDAELLAMPLNRLKGGEGAAERHSLPSRIMAFLSDVGTLFFPHVRFPMFLHTFPI